MERMKRVTLAAVVASTALSIGCGGNAPAAPAPCDEACQDGVALRALRVGMRLAYNFAIATKPVGMQDVTAPCIPTGSVHIVGDAQSNAMLGTSQIDLTYTFTNCKNPSKNMTPERNYEVTMNGVVNEKGMLAMGGPTTSLIFTASDVTIAGKVYDPALDYDKANNCTLVANQDGNNVNGELCGRTVKGFSGF